MIFCQVLMDLRTLTAKLAIWTLEHISSILEYSIFEYPILDKLASCCTGYCIHDDRLSHANSFRHQLNQVTDFDFAFIASGLDRI